MRSLLAVIIALAALPAAAQPKPVELYIGYSVGGGYDVYARLLSRHMGRHLPGNPVIVPKNMPGAGSLALANWLYSAAPRDGTAFGTLGSANDEVSVCAAWGKSGITKFEDLYARPVFIGGTGAGADTDLFPKVMNNILGTKMKLVTGYPGGNDITLAMQRGEVEARCGWSWSSIKSGHLQWVKDGPIKLLVQLSLDKHPDLPNVPLIMDLVKTPEQRAIFRLVFARQVMGRPFLAPPGLPPERLPPPRRALMGKMKDPAVLGGVDQIKLEITPVDGEAVQKLVAEIYATAPEIVRRAADAVK